jgi:methylthioribose-1-phosphate isomerase
VRDHIPTTVITESMAGPLMRQGSIDFVVVGADRIAANGDVANKVGTYTVAMMAQAHGVPFYVAAPLSTIDLATPTGAEIPIEQRASREVTHLGTTRLAPEGASVWNPAFDVTPAHLVTGIITEKGIARAPYGESLAALFADMPAQTA